MVNDTFCSLRRSRLVILAHLKDHLPQEPAPPGPESDLVAAGVLVPPSPRRGRSRCCSPSAPFWWQDYRGQIAFPGGLRDPEDPHLLGTALRETFEDILGLGAEAAEVLVMLPPVATITGYHITSLRGRWPHPTHLFGPVPGKSSAC